MIKIWGLSQEERIKTFAEVGGKLPVKHVAHSDEIAEAYLYAMK